MLQRAREGGKCALAFELHFTEGSVSSIYGSSTLKEFEILVAHGELAPFGHDQAASPIALQQLQYLLILNIVGRQRNAETTAAVASLQYSEQQLLLSFAIMCGSSI